MRRKVIADHYAEIVGALNSSADTVKVNTVITYQDGTSANRLITLRVTGLNGHAPARAAEDKQVVGSTR